MKLRRVENHKLESVTLDELKRDDLFCDGHRLCVKRIWDDLQLPSHSGPVCMVALALNNCEPMGVNEFADSTLYRARLVGVDDDGTLLWERVTS